MKDARKVKDDEGSLPTGPGDQIPSAPSPADLGRQGEEEAARYLRSLGWTILGRNLRAGKSEIDLACLEPCRGDLPNGVIVEVKCRSGTGFGDPLEAITYAKRQRLRQLATSWRRASGLAISSLRVDAVGILKLPGSAPLIRHVRGVA